MICLHCGKFKSSRPRGLCWRCFYSPTRHLYPPISKFGRRGSIQDAYGRHRKPPAATTAVPGSAEKIQVMSQRAAAGVSLFHPGDR